MKIRTLTSPFLALVLSAFVSTPTLAGSYFQDFQGLAAGSTNMNDGSQLFSTHMGSVAQVFDATFKELQLTDINSNSVRSAFLLPALDSGTNIYAFSAKWNSQVYGNFPNAADGFSFTYGPIGGLNLSSGIYSQENGFGSGITFSVNTFGNPGFHIIVNGTTITSKPYVAGAQWGTNNSTRNFFEVDWHVNLGLTVRLNNQIIFNGVQTPGFIVSTSNRFAWAARTGGFSEEVRLDNIVVVSGGYLREVAVTSPYYTDTVDGSAPNAFDGNPGTWWSRNATNGYVGGTIQSKGIRVYAVASSGNGNRTQDPKTWTLEGSNNSGTNWSACGTGTVSYLNNTETRAWLSTNSTLFKSARIRIQQNNGNVFACTLGALRLYELLAVTSSAPFRLVSTPNIPNIGIGANAWADIDNDGDLDIAVSGRPGSTPAQGYLYRNQGNDVFTLDTGTSLPGIEAGVLTWGDYNNDGFADLFIAGDQGTFNLIARIYKNNGNGTLTLTVSLPGMSYGNGTWMDYNNDGLLDILYAGQVGGGLWRNNGDDTFTKVDAANTPSSIESSVSSADFNSDGFRDFVQFDGGQPKLRSNIDGSGSFGSSLLAFINMDSTASTWGDMDADGQPDIFYAGRGVDGNFSATGYRINNSGDLSASGSISNFVFGRNGSVAMGDFDNDGDLDVLHAGSDFPNNHSRFMRNDGSGGIGGDTNIPLDAFTEGNFSPGDYDQDGRLDYLVSGAIASINDGVTHVWRNEGFATNKLPAAPSGLSSVFTQDLFKLSWNTPGDDTTPTNGLSYNVRIGKTPGGIDVMSPLANPTSGLRRVAEAGNAGWVKFKLADLFIPGTYYWSVQAIDNMYAGGPFAAEQSFTIPFIPPDATTLDPTQISGTQATLNGTARNYGVTTTVWFAWGTTPSLGSNTAPQVFDPLAETFAVSNLLAGINSGVRIYYRIIASNHVGVVLGDVISFIPLTLGSRFDLTQPGDTVDLISSPDNVYNGTEYIIDNSGYEYFGVNDNAGVSMVAAVSLTGYPARAFTWISSSDNPQYDASSLVIEGSLNGTNFVMVFSNSLPEVSDIMTMTTFTLDNETIYPYYRISFPSQRDESYVDVSEIELLPYPPFSSAQDSLNLTFIGLGDVMTGPENLFDGVLDDNGNNKMEIQNMNAPAILDIIPASGRSILKGFQYIGAFDDPTFPERRPSSVELFGSDDGTNFVKLTTFSPSVPISSLYMRDYGLLDNTASFAQYRLVFATPVSGTTLQISDIRLFGISDFTPLESWRLQYFGTTNNAGSAANDADDDGDDNLNLIEFASGTSPTDMNPSPLTLAPGNSFIVRFPQDTNAIGEVSWFVEATTSLLGSWSNKTGTMQPVSTNGSVRTINFIPSSMNATSEHYRLKVIEP